MPLKIQYASDLHLEFPENRRYIKQNPLKPAGDVLVLAGDIVPFAVMDRYQDFFSYLSDHFVTTYWLPGNHEYYHFDVINKQGTFCEKIRENVFLLNNTSLMHGNSKLIFSTLWSKISLGHQWEIEKRLNDFHQIKYNAFRFSSEHYNQLHEESLAFIKSEITDQQAENLVVISHHCPTFFNYPQQYKGDVLNEAFSVELFELIESSQINYWLYGHHHTNTPEFEIGNTKLITNQLGYVQQNEHQLFEFNKCFEL